MQVTVTRCAASIYVATCCYCCTFMSEVRCCRCCRRVSARQHDCTMFPVRSVYACRRKARTPWPVVQATYCIQCAPALNETEYRPFWISWKDGIVAYGNGSRPGLSVVGVFADPAPIAVNYMSIASHAAVVADWIIPQQLFNTSTGTSIFFILLAEMPIYFTSSLSLQ